MAAVHRQKETVHCEALQYGSTAPIHPSIGAVVVAAIFDVVVLLLQQRRQPEPQVGWMPTTTSLFIYSVSPTEVRRIGGSISAAECKLYEEQVIWVSTITSLFDTFPYGGAKNTRMTPPDLSRPSRSYFRLAFLHFLGKIIQRMLISVQLHHKFSGWGVAQSSRSAHSASGAATGRGSG